MVTAVCLVIDALGVPSKRRQDKVRFAYFVISSRLFDQVGAEPTEAGKVLLTPSSERVWDSFQRDLAALKEWDALWASL